MKYGNQALDFFSAGMNDALYSNNVWFACYETDMEPKYSMLWTENVVVKCRNYITIFRYEFR